MKNNNLEQLKNLPFFKKWDVCIYILLVVAIVLLFWIFLFSNFNTLSKVEIKSNENGEERLIATIDFPVATVKIEEQFKDLTKIEKSSSYQDLTIYHDQDLTKFNKIRIDNSGKVYVVDANCSYHKDCTLFPKIEKNGAVIICVPHGLTIEAKGAGETSDPIIG